ncbi:hypothetical protein SD70_18645 [Gordoniibacillus kamchatkensis]|uniref:Uncharacterized protein n=1 Tax=Gordoniibacillus kamchatkensis TaxID=1590651 RepID=A0ABR5AF36_9BACL|nr:hypothetical protein [Paenibacillus sp. VKM B-2647]KIL39661.1 hypothetical protein SD70_18645 [Paenibacillus sp. VKM B-2647]
MIVYDTRFNANEWFVIVGFCIGYGMLFLLPRRFSYKITLLFIICGIYSGFFYDHSLSVEPKDFYDVNDTSLYQPWDFLSYLMYGPLSYLFFYIWDCVRFKFRFAPLYIFAWGLVAVAFEKFAIVCHVFHYKNGYRLAYSFPIYLLTYSIWSALYYYFKVRQANAKA